VGELAIACCARSIDFDASAERTAGSQPSARKISDGLVTGSFAPPLAANNSELPSGEKLAPDATRDDATGEQGRKENERG
jgi:hypothetical protein